MKTSHAAFVLTITMAFVLAAGCGKKEEATPTAQDTQKPAEQASTQLQQAAQQQAASAQQTLQQQAATVQQAVQQQAATVQQAVQQQAAAPQQAASSMVALAGTEAQSLVDKAKALMADKNWAGALAALKDAASKQLTTEQKSLIDQLIAEVQKAMAGNTATTLKDQATQTLGGLLGGKK